MFNIIKALIKKLEPPVDDEINPSLKLVKELNKMIKDGRKLIIISDDGVYVKAILVKE